MLAWSTNPTSKPPRVSITRLRKWASFWFLFIGFGALLGVGMLWLAPVQLGMAPLLVLIQQHLPFGEVFFAGFVWPGVFLLLIIGLPHLVGALLVLRRSRLVGWWTVGAGLILVGWTALQIFVVFGPNPMSIAYMVFGIAEALTGGLLLKLGSQRS